MAIIHLESGSRCREACLRRQPWASRRGQIWVGTETPGCRFCCSTAAGGGRQFLTPAVSPAKKESISTFFCFCELKARAAFLFSANEKGELVVAH